MSGLAALAVAAVLLVLNGMFVAAEFALIASRRSRIEALAATGDRRARSALAGVRELSLMLAGAQLGITMASLGLGAVAEPALGHVLEDLLHRAGLPEAWVVPIGYTIALSVVVFLHLVIGEMAPKSWAIAHPERSALMLARPFRAFVVVVKPLIAVLNWMANGVVRLFGATPQDELAAAHSPTDLQYLVRESGTAGTLAEHEQDLLSRALVLSARDAETVMIPRRDLVTVSAGATVEELEGAAASSGRSRLPVFAAADLDELVGIVHVKDLLRLDTAHRARMTAGDLARPAMLVPESRRIEDLLRDMRDRRQHVALVVDEYGSVNGLVSLEDIVEELIGEFEDETDVRVARRLRRRPDGRLVVPGDLRPYQLAELAGVTLPEGPYETVAGYLIRTLDRLPQAGDQVTVGAVELEVVATDRHRITEVVVRPAPRGRRTDEPVPARAAAAMRPDAGA